MTRRWRVADEAERDIEQAAEWYERAREGLGFEFARTVRATLHELRETPMLTSPVPRAPRGLRLRRRLVARFPYVILVLETDDEDVVVAVGHVRRHPNYWRARLNKPSP